jgi:hypothetical protein
MSLEVKNVINFIGTTKSASVSRSQEKMDSGGSLEKPNVIISIGTNNTESLRVFNNKSQVNEMDSLRFLEVKNVINSIGTFLFVWVVRPNK